MPSKEIIAANTIVETQLPPHLRNKQKGSKLIINSNNNANDDNKIYIAAGEIIGALKPIYIGNDGKAYLADNISNPAHAISVTAGNVNALIEIAITGKEIVVSNTMDVGNKIYLGNEEIITIPEITSGKIYQKLGIVKSSSVIFVLIEEAYIIE